ncbi:MAG: helix-turn-helix domain-containing protein [Chloroflexota bacterium]
MDAGQVLTTWGAVISRYRRWQHLNRRELATRAGMSPVFLGEIERGEKDPSSQSLVRLAAGLGVPLSELFLRVGAQLDHGAGDEVAAQTVLPRLVREDDHEYLRPVETARDETAFDLYKVARGLGAQQQVALLLLARSLSKDA